MQPLVYSVLVHSSEGMKLKKKQSVYKPGSVPYKNKVSVIYLRLLSPVGSSGLPSDVGRATLINAGLHDLTTPKMHSPHITIRLVGSYPTFSPLPFPERKGGYFLLHYSTLAGSFLLGSRMLCVARTFLLYTHVPATNRPTAFHCKGTQINRNGDIIGKISCDADKNN